MQCSLAQLDTACLPLQFLWCRDRYPEARHGACGELDVISECVAERIRSISRSRLTVRTSTRNSSIPIGCAITSRSVAAIPIPGCFGNHAHCIEIPVSTERSPAHHRPSDSYGVAGF